MNDPVFWSGVFAGLACVMTGALITFVVMLALWSHEPPPPPPPDTLLPPAPDDARGLVETMPGYWDVRA